MARPRRPIPPAASHGDRQRQETIQQVGQQVAQGQQAPQVPPNGAQVAGPGGGASSSPAPPIPQAPDVFGPSSGPTPGHDPVLPQDGLGVLRALYTKYPNEDLRRLLERAAEMHRGQ